MLCVFTPHGKLYFPSCSVLTELHRGVHFLKHRGLELNWSPKAPYSQCREVGGSHSGGTLTYFGHLLEDNKP